LPDKPSIAVLPFQNMSGDPEQEYFADGLAQEAEAHAQLALRLSPRGYGIGTAHLAVIDRHFRILTATAAVGTNRTSPDVRLESAFGGRAECAGRPARSRWCKSITMKE